jgi:hypothetical protein
MTIESMIFNQVSYLPTRQAFIMQVLIILKVPLDSLEDR